MREKSNAENEDIIINKNKKRRYIRIEACAILVVIAVLGTLAACFFVLRSSKIYKTAYKLVQVDRLISKYYNGDVDYKKIDESVLSGYMEALDDKYGFYKSSDDAETVADSFVGDAEGIGVTVYYNSEDNTLFVFRVDSGGPAEKAGIKEADKITAIGSQLVSELGYEKSIEALKKQVGSKISITYDRDGKEHKTVVEYTTFVRQTVYTQIKDEVGYMCFTAFNKATVEQFNSAFDSLKSKKIKALVFDLRDNGGGTVDSVCKILNSLVGKCDLMTVEYANGERKVLYTSDENELELPFAVLTNGNTASASELFAATIRDMKKGVLVGSTTYGKGVMQRTYFLNDKSCVRFTIGKFFPAGGVCFNNEGLKPDIEVSQSKYKYYNISEDPCFIKAFDYLKREIK